MNRTLQKEIADYREMVEVTRQDGRALRDRLVKENWHLIDSLLEVGQIPCAIHPDLWADLCLTEELIFDEEEEFYRLDRSISEDEREMIIELPVVG